MINMMEQHDTMTISCGDPLMELLKDVRELLNEQEVVRCKDCKHSTVSDNGLIKCGHTFRSADFFCADGEKRD